MYDFSDVEPQQSSDLIPDGTFAKVAMTIQASISLAVLGLVVARAANELK